MDEIQLLGTALTEPDPPRDAVDRSRRRLRQAMRGPVRKRRTRPLLIGAAVTATATAATVAAVVTDPGEPRTGTPVTVQLSGRQVLLSAAAAAEASPAGSGAYWHVRTVTAATPAEPRPGPTESWTKRDGQTWLSSTPGLVSRVGRRPLVRTTKLDFEDVQRLPADPAGLKAALLKAMNGVGRADDRHLQLVNLLQTMVSTAPAPPKVRGAAFRVLASLPDIKNLGRAPDGYLLQISYRNGKVVDGTEKIVVDPKTTRLRVVGWYGFGDGQPPAGPSTTTAGWTNSLSGRLVPWKTQLPFLSRH
jgi:hypothetical protein